MLKKVTLACALALVICLVAGAAFIPFAIRDVLQDGEQILGKFVRSTEVSHFSGKGVDTLELHFNSLPIYIEQSGDEQIYLRIEGLFAKGYAVNSQQKDGEGKNILSLSLDDNTLFFDTDVPYLLRSGIIESPVAWVIVRIPDWVAIETSGSGWNIRSVGDVRFANREYYDERLWLQGDNWEQYMQVEERWHQAAAIKTVFLSELQQALLMLSTEEIDFEDYSERVEQAAATCQERLLQQLRIPDGESLQNEMLQTLAKNYIELQKGAARQEGRMLETEEYSEEYYSLRDRQWDLQNAAEEAFSEFMTSYRNLLLSLPDQEDAEETGEEFAAIDVVSTAENIASSALAPEVASSAPSVESPTPLSPAEQVLSAPSVYTEE